MTQSVAPAKMPVAPSTGKKKKAQRVFGKIVVEDSLSYSPSPAQHRGISAESRSTKFEDTESQSVVTNLFVSTDESTTSKVSSRRSEETAATNQSNKENVLNTWNVSPISTLPLQESSRNSNFSSLRDPSLDSSLSTLDPLVSQKPGVDNVKKTTRDEMMKQTNALVNQALHSVNESLNAVRKAKQMSMREKAKAAAKLREQLETNKMEGKMIQEETEKIRRERLGLQRQLSSKLAKERALAQQKHRDELRDLKVKEVDLQSDVYRQQQNQLREEEQRRRRESREARANLRRNAQEGKLLMKLNRIEEDKAILEERESYSYAIRDTTKDDADKRRKSFQLRGEHARRIRQLYREREEKRKANEQEDYKLKREGDIDAEKYKEGLEEQRRASLAFRGKVAMVQKEEQLLQEQKQKQDREGSFELKFAGYRDMDTHRQHLAEVRRKSLQFRGREHARQRALQKAQKEEEQNEQHSHYEAKWEGERDAQSYEQQLLQDRRRSLAQRNEEARLFREKLQSEKREAQHVEHQYWELKNLAEKDMEEYNEKLKEERRHSLAKRNETEKQVRFKEKEQRAKKLKREHEMYELKFAADRDADAYKKSILEERRQSLELRNQLAHSQREEYAIRQSAEMEERHANFELKQAAERDAAEYRQQVDKERREDINYRNREHSRHRKVMEELRLIVRDKESESLMLKWAGEDDAKAYLKSLEEERRKSLQLRGKEARRQKELKEEQRRQELQASHEDEEIKSASQKDVENYLRECAERRRTSLEFRRKEAQVQRLEEQSRLSREREEREANNQLERLAQLDVEEYVKECRRRRRLSLVSRAKERRRGLAWQTREKNRQVEEFSLETTYRSLDRRYVELAREKEKAARIAALARHSGLTL